MSQQNEFDYLDFLKFLNPQSLGYHSKDSCSTRPAQIDRYSVASALVGLDDWVQVWAYILANHQAKASEMYMCQRVLMSIIYAQMEQLNINNSRKLITANNIAWGVITMHTSHRHRTNDLKKAEACSIDKQTFLRTYKSIYHRAEQEIATWENQIRDNLRSLIKD